MTTETKTEDVDDMRVFVISAEQIVANKLRLEHLEQFEGLGIGQAVQALKHGLRVGRKGWNGKGMHLELQVPDAHSKMSLPYVFMFTAQGDRVPWLCSQTDLLASDWEVVS